ncbi:unnamed protein product [Ilex paraguariensis]|uniref:DUF4283 domain-containing protein n=1 Tax=Ilex paraguariensis TaxID=185542 RepID=A0ABC8T3T9_9AQUA
MDEEMQQLWRIFTLLEEENLGVNLLDQGYGDLGEKGKLCVFGKVMSFNNMLDKNRILEGMPWSFDNQLVILKGYDSTIQGYDGTIQGKRMFVKIGFNNLSYERVDVVWGMVEGSIR